MTDQDSVDQDPGELVKTPWFKTRRVQDAVVPGPADQDPGAGDGPVRYAERGRTAVITLNRPRYRNAQNSAMTYALDAAFYRAADDPGSSCRAGGRR